MAIKIVVFDDSYKCVIADVEEVVGADIGEPDCQLTNPYEFIEFKEGEEGAPSPPSSWVFKNFKKKEK